MILRILALKNKEGTINFLNKYGIYFKDYKQKYYYWELLKILIRIYYALILSLFITDNQYKGTLISLGIILNAYLVY